MKYLPAEDITYKTKLPEAEVIKRLDDNIEPFKVIRFGLFSKESTKPYQGKREGHSFNISRIINYRNSFLPRIHGNIEPAFDGTQIKVRMRLHVAVMAFIGFWCGIVGLACIVFLTQSFDGTDFQLIALVPFGMLVFIYLLTLLAFKRESTESKNYLQSLFEAEIIED